MNLSEWGSYGRHHWEEKRRENLTCDRTYGVLLVKREQYKTRERKKQDRHKLSEQLEWEMRTIFTLTLSSLFFVFSRLLLLLFYFLFESWDHSLQKFDASFISDNVCSCVYICLHQWRRSTFFCHFSLFTYYLTRVCVTHATSSSSSLSLTQTYSSLAHFV